MTDIKAQVGVHLLGVESEARHSGPTWAGVCERDRKCHDNGNKRDAHKRCPHAQARR